GSVAIRQRVRSSPPSNKAKTTLVFPASTTSSIVRSSIASSQGEAPAGSEITADKSSPPGRDRHVAGMDDTPFPVRQAQAQRAIGGDPIELPGHRRPIGAMHRQHRTQRMGRGQPAPKQRNGAFLAPGLQFTPER